MTTPKIQTNPSFIRESDDVTLTCVTKCSALREGTELHFSFYRNGRTVRGLNVSDTYRVRSSQLEDSGNYTCEVRTVSDTVRKISDELYIQIRDLFSRPKIQTGPYSIHEGDAMIVTCHTRLNPLRAGTELHYTFYRDGRTVRGYNVSDTYRVRSSQLEDSGNYTCEVRTTSDTVKKNSNTLHIQIQGDPEILTLELLFKVTLCSKQQVYHRPTSYTHLRPVPGQCPLLPKAK
ncbi:hypothetical protein AB205_0219700, partial [Aquarana catesbeiana]